MGAGLACVAVLQKRCLCAGGLGERGSRKPGLWPAARDGNTCRGTAQVSIALQKSAGAVAKRFSGGSSGLHCAPLPARSTSPHSRSGRTSAASPESITKISIKQRTRRQRLRGRRTIRRRQRSAQEAPPAAAAHVAQHRSEPVPVASSHLQGWRWRDGNGVQHLYLLIVQDAAQRWQVWSPLLLVCTPTAAGSLPRRSQPGSSVWRLFLLVMHSLVITNQESRTAILFVPKGVAMQRRKPLRPKKTGEKMKVVEDGRQMGDRGRLLQGSWHGSVPEAIMLQGNCWVWVREDRGPAARMAARGVWWGCHGRAGAAAERSTHLDSAESGIVQTKMMMQRSTSRATRPTTASVPPMTVPMAAPVCGEQLKQPRGCTLSSAGGA